MTFKATCSLCERTWEHDRETTCCFWCGCKKFKLSDKLPTGEEFWDDDTIPGRVWADLSKDLNLD